ncbi:MAG: hydroxymethylbilane synthase [Chloroflexi bacterium]|nr:hydroxymethylbilane synthase [Chloroflexota bacterium]
MTGRQVVIGTRGSRLAMAQAGLVAEALERSGCTTRISIIETAGDRRAPDTAWGEGAFVAAIERALLAGDVDVAVHSAKDVPTDEDRRLRIGAYLPRADARDALVVRLDAAARRLDDLPPCSRVGTDSPRRTGFVLARRPDLLVHPLHGNVDTRLRRLDAGETDALVLACAGLDRIGLEARIAERIDPDVVPPAPGQGAIAVQVRRDDAEVLAAVRAVDDPDTRLAVEAERAFLAACGGGCRAPIGALATVSGDALTLLGAIARPGGSGPAFERRAGPATDGTSVARGLAQAFDRDLRVAAGSLGRSGEPAGPRVLVTRAADQSGELLAALAAGGLDPVSVPAIEVELLGTSGRPGGEPEWDGFDWIVVTSTNGVRAVLERATAGSATFDAVRWAAVGRATAGLLDGAGFAVSFTPTRSDGAALAAELPVRRGERVLVVRGDLADAEVAATLRGRGATVDDLVAYRTREAPASSRPLLAKAFAAGRIGAIVFTSGSTVRGLVSLARSEGLDPTDVPVVCIGPETADCARSAGFTVRAVSADPDVAALAAATAHALAGQPLEVP